jgi:hypothetical protein
MDWVQQTGRDVVLYVHDDERREYSRNYPWAKLVKVPDGARGHMGRVRAHIFASEQKPCFVVDDDVEPRLYAGPGRPPSFKSIRHMFDTYERHLIKGDVPLAGMGTPMYRTLALDDCKERHGDVLSLRDSFVWKITAVRPEIFRTAPLDRLPSYDDYAIVVHALQNGGTITSHLAQYREKSVGGGASGRTREEVMAHIDAFVECYPDFVRKVPSPVRTMGHDIGVGCRVGWSYVKQNKPLPRAHKPQSGRIINLRGTNGSGKSTLVRKIMGDGPYVPVYLGKRPVGILIGNLFVLGHYDITNGGFDTLKNVQEGYNLIAEHADKGHTVLFEGKCNVRDIDRLVEMGAELFYLDTPMDVSAQSVLDRGHAIPRKTVEQIYKGHELEKKFLSAINYPFQTVSRSNGEKIIREALR